MSGPRPHAQAAPADRGRGGRLGLELFVYNLLLLLALPAIACWLLWRAAVRRKPIGSLRHRLGLVPRLGGPGYGRPTIWLHAVSAGEVGAARPVLEALRAGLPGARIAMSTVTEAGMAVARNTCQADAFFYLPLDSLCTMGWAMRRLRPQLVVITEKELWPNFLGLARLSGARVLVVNGRVSNRMMRRGRWAARLVRWLYRLPDHLCVQSEVDARRLIALGVSRPRITVAGNTKVDAMAQPDEEATRRLASDLAASDDELWLVAGSTHPGEEEAVAEAFRRIREALPGARLLVAPRHLERVAAVSAAIADLGWPVVRRSDGLPPSPDAIVILDTMGELRAAYGLGIAGFVGGTLVPIGGHNLLEPVAAGRAVLFGPHTESCEDMAELVLTSGVGVRIRNPAELAEAFVHTAMDPARRAEIAAAGRALIARQRGAARRCAEIACELLNPESTL